jgi:riboflavin synthase
LFTGIVEDVGRVLHIDTGDAGQLVVQTSTALQGLKLGDSISVNGTCLTVVELSSDSFRADLSWETFRRTNLGDLQTGNAVNLERPLAAGDRMGGHVVQGHVDGTGRVQSFKPEGESYLFRFSAPKRLMPYVVEKGFVSVDGASLTVVKKGAASFSVAVIPYTLANTVLGERQKGDRVNLEVDILAKYVESLLAR